MLEMKEENNFLKPIIELDNVCFSYNNQTSALKNINLKVNQGETVSILGTNGSGKSTLAKIIDGIYIQTSGDIFIDSIKMDSKNFYELRKKISLIFQNPDDQFITNNVKDELAFSLENMCVKPKDMDEIINKTLSEIDMIDYINFDPKNLSGGQKQKIAIAASLIRNTQILILDETFSMLDSKSKLEIENLISNIKEKNPKLTILSITHNLNDALKADRIIILNKGEIIKDDFPQNVFNDLSLIKKSNIDLPYILKLISKLNELGIPLDYTLDLNSLIDKLCL